MFALEASTIFTPTKILKDTYIIVSDGKVVKLTKTLPTNVDKIDSYESCIVAPGFVDIHTHGGFGVDIMYSCTNDIKKFIEKLPNTGVTSFVPSTVTDSFESLKRFSEKFSSIKYVKGSEVIGIHFEGPYINIEMAGAQSKDHIRCPSVEEVKVLSGFFNHIKKRVTLAPELEGGIDFIKALKGLNIITSIGHTCASYQQTIQAFSAGARLVTHIFNGMKPFHHREPGVVGAALNCPNVYAETILDLIHLHPATVELVYRCKGSKRMVLVTDAIAGAGLDDGTFKLGPMGIIVKDGISRLSDGTLAGSTLTMDKAVKNAVKIGIPLIKVLEMATLTPCKAMMVEGKGYIREGNDADLIVLDKNLNVISTYIKGEKFFSN
ncbi:MAG: N-acetylglucosamine-6-phosphate deacetylase [Nitrososphaeria archaeon]|nr:N-acetylglucosamine-6-phosphate deacetylase [Nitrososphaeria archaeon]